MRQLDAVSKKPLRCVDYAPDGATIAAGGEDRVVRVWDRVSAKQTLALAGHKSGVYAVAFHPNGRCLASGSSRASLCLWELPTGQRLAAPVLRSDRFIACLAYSRDGKRLLVATRIAAGGGSVAGGIAGWWTFDRQPAWQLFSIKHVYSLAVAVAPNDTVAIAAGDGPTSTRAKSTSMVQVHLDSKAVKKIQQPARILAMAVSATHLATAIGNDVQLTSLKTAAGGALLGGHDRAVRGLAFSPDGQQLVSVGLDDLLIVWDVRAGCERARFDLGIGPLYAVAFAPDGMTIAAVGNGAVVIDTP